MKNIKSKLLTVFTVIFLAGSSVVVNQAYANMDVPCMESSGSCGYKKRECWFKPDTKCSGNGTECPTSDPCGNPY